MNNLSPLAIATIGFICLIIIIMNVGLITFLRYKPVLKMKPPQAPKGQDMTRLINIIKDPFGEEREQLDQLAGLVNRLDENIRSDQDQGQ